MAKKKSKKPATKRRPRAQSATPKLPSEPVAQKPSAEDADSYESREGWNVVARQELAQLMGVHPDTVTDYARSDMPVITRGGQGKLSEYDAIECLAWQRQKMGRNALENAKTRATENQAQLSEIKIKVALGQYLDRDEVDADVGRIVGVIRAQLLNLPRLAVQSGRIDRDQEAGVKEVVREVLTTLSQWVDDRATTEPPADALLLGETLEEES